jgi:hypothetical protein
VSRRVLVRLVVTAVAVAVAVTCAVLAPAAGASAPALPEQPIPVHVTFNGSGQFHYDNSEGSHAVADDQLDWTVEYRAELQPDGTLTSVSTPPSTTAGTYTFTDDFYEVACSGSISTVPQPGPFPPGAPNPPPETTPVPQADGLVIQGITYLSTDPSRFADCVGARGDFDGSGEAADGVGTVLNQSLPGALAARIPQIPRQAFLAGGVALRTIAVSSADAPTQIPASCADLFGIDDPAKCTESLSWSGTVLLDATAGCPLILAGPSPVCMPPSGTPVAALTQGVETDATGPGTARMSATASEAVGAHAAIARRVVIAAASVKVSHAGRVRLRPRLTSAGKTLFKHSRRVKVTIQIVFKPQSGRAHTSRLNTVLLR